MKKFAVFILILCVMLIIGKLAIDSYYEKKKNMFVGSNVEVNTEVEWDNMSNEQREAIEAVIELAETKLGYVYVWGAKGETMTEDRLETLISYHGEEQYPLDRSEYIGRQAFDCSGFTHWLYEQVTGENIGYSTFEQREILDKYKVEGVLQPGDLIFEPRHVILYIGGGKVIHTKMIFGSVRKDSVMNHMEGEVYRPIDYIEDQR